MLRFLAHKQRNALARGGVARRCETGRATSQNSFKTQKAKREL